MIYKMTTQINTVLDVDPVLNFVGASTNLLVRGGLYNRGIERVNTSGNPTINNIAFSTPLTRSFVYSRFFYIEYKISFSFTGTGSNGVNLIDMTKFSFRPFPLNNSCTNATVRINGDSFSSVPKDFVSVILNNYDQYSEKYLSVSGCPNKKDFSQSYDEFGVRSIFRLRGQQQDSYDNYGRNKLHTIHVLTNTVNSATIEATFREPLFVSPLISLSNKQQGMTYIDKLSVELSMSGDYKHLLSMTSAQLGDLSSVNYSFNSASLCFESFTPSEKIIIPKNLYYNNSKIQRYTSSVGQGLLSGTYPNSNTTRITSSNLQLTGIPNRIIIAISEDDSYKTASSSDCFLSIENLSITLGNLSGQLSSYSIYDLYNLSYNNGFNGEFSDFVNTGTFGELTGLNSGQISTGIGSMIILIPGKDIFASNGGIELGPNMGTNLNFQFSATVGNGSGKNIQNMQINTWVVYNEMMEILEDGSITTRQNYITPEIKELAYNSGLFNSSVEESLEGGFSFADIVSGIKKGVNFIKPALKPMREMTKTALKMIPSSGYTQSAANILDAAEPVFNALGLGEYDSDDEKKNKKKTKKKLNLK